MAYFQKIAMLPNDSDAPFLARRGGEERHEESEMGQMEHFATTSK